MAINKHLQLLRNSAYAANYDAAVALIKTHAPTKDGEPIIVRYYEGEEVHGLLGVAYGTGETKNVHYVELGGMSIAAIKEAIAKAQAAATTKVQLVDGEQYLKISGKTNEDGSTTYELSISGVADASATAQAILDAEKSAKEYASGRTDSIKIVQVTENLGENTAIAYKLEGGSANSVQIEIPKDQALKSVLQGTMVDGEFVSGATGDVIKFEYTLANGEVKTVTIDLQNVITEAELKAVAEGFAGKGLVAEDGELHVNAGSYILVDRDQDDAISVDLEGIDAELVADGTEVKTAITTAKEEAITSAITYTNEVIASLDAEKSHTDGHVTVTVKQVDGKIDAVIVEESEIKASEVTVEDTQAKFTGSTVEEVLAELDGKIASVQGDALGIKEGHGIDFSQITEEGSDKSLTQIAVNCEEIKSDVEGNILEVKDNKLYVAPCEDYKVEGGNGIAVTEKADAKQTISVVIAEHVQGADANDMLAATEGGITMSNIWDCGEF